MSKENLAFWLSQQRTDPAFVKPITGKQYKGSSPQPYYMVRRMTEAFGMAGHGWGCDLVSERFERFGETEALHIAVVKLWYKNDGERCEITQLGQTRAAYTSGAGKHIVDEDAPKKSFTDAMVKCMSYLGFAGDIFGGMWDDSKYQAELQAQFAKKPPYDPKGIAKNSNAWLKMIESGATTGEQIAAKIEKQFTLTEDQRKQICDLGMPDRGPDSTDDTHAEAV